MRVAVAVALGLLALVAVSSAMSPSEEARFVFNAWMRSHGKTYTTAAELEHRFQVFLSNMEVVERHNQEAAQGLHSYTLGLTPFADLTNQEYRAFLGYRRSNSSAPHGSIYKPLPTSTLPTSVDWRTKGVVTPVKDQGQCGSCWSFSATGSMEGAHALATGTLVSLSEQNLIDCVKSGSYTCDTGGVMQDGFAYAIANRGIEGEADYPYCTCSGNRCRFDKTKIRATFKSYTTLPSGSESALQSAVAERPGVSIAIDASSQQFQLYKNGVFNYAGCSSTELDHGVLVVGYGDYSGTAYWLVKNSWSASWGMNGYILMSRNRNNQCGIATDASYVTV